MADYSPQSVFNVTTMGKRKRCRVSYIDTDIIFDDEDEVLSEDEAEAESDGEYGKRKPKKSQRKPKKQRRLFSNQKKAQKKEELKPFPFLSLPAELREYIYQLALFDPNGLSIVAKTKNYRRTICRGEIEGNTGNRGWYHQWHQDIRNNTRIGRNPKPRFSLQDPDEPPLESPDFLIPNLLAVNRQIHEEAAAVLYMQPIIVDDTTTLHNFLVTIGSNNMKLLRDLTVKGWGYSRGTRKAMNHCSLVLLAGAVNLKVLYLDCMIGYFRSNGRLLARQIWRDGYTFLEAYSAANNSKEAAADVVQLYDGNFDRDGDARHTCYRNYHQEKVPPKGDFEEEFKKELRRFLGCTVSEGEKLVASN